MRRSGRTARRSASKKRWLSSPSNQSNGCCDRTWPFSSAWEQAEIAVVARRYAVRAAQNADAAGSGRRDCQDRHFNLRPPRFPGGRQVTTSEPMRLSNCDEDLDFDFLADVRPRGDRRRPASSRRRDGRRCEISMRRSPAEIDVDDGHVPLYLKCAASGADDAGVFDDQAVSGPSGRCARDGRPWRG